MEGGRRPRRNRQLDRLGSSPWYSRPGGGRRGRGESLGWYAKEDFLFNCFGVFF